MPTDLSIKPSPYAGLKFVPRERTAQQTPRTPGKWSIEVNGPRLWEKIHRWTLTADLTDPASAFIKQIIRELGCGQCGRDAKAWVKANPPRTESREALFGWGVDWHNSVNRKKDKPEIGVDEAMEQWENQRRASASTSTNSTNGL